MRITPHKSGLLEVPFDNNKVLVFQSMMVLPRNHLEHKEGKGWFREK
jgi:hypothetical protein